jgi:GrpB-like predicted nucleotidyltransferase (UPF0157 family)
MRTIVIAPYDPAWPESFERVRATVWPALRDVALTVEHVGSTAVPGLAAKPIVDVTVVVPAAADVPAAIARLAAIGYVHQGDLGIAEREAFTSPPGSPPHHLYLCPSGSATLANHLGVRDYLRSQPDAALEYAALKQRLAAQFPHDIDRYVAGKTEFLLRILRAAAP